MSKFIELSEKDHVYHDKYGNKYTSVSELVGSLMPVFQEQIIARAVAKKEEKSVEDVLAEWKRKKDLAVDHGNHVHENIESFLEESTCTDTYMLPFLNKLKKEFEDYGSIRCEKDVAYSKDHQIAGTPDIKAYRSRKIMDIFDFKTNLERGIQYKDKYKKYMNIPVDHLEACNYNEYAIKLSLYGLMIEITEGYKIGCLGLYYITDHHKGIWKYIPIPYMKKYAELILTQHVVMNKIKPIKEYAIEAFD